MRNRPSSGAVALAGLWLVAVLAPVAKGSPPPPGIPGGQVVAIATPESVGAVGLAVLTGDRPPELIMASAGQIELRAFRADGSLGSARVQPVTAAAPLGVAELFLPDGVGIVDRAARAIIVLEVDDSGVADARHPLRDAGRVPLAGDPVAVASRITDNFIDDPYTLIAVAERDTRDVRIFRGPHAAAEVADLGAAPTSVAVGEDDEGTPVVAVGTDDGVELIGVEEEDLSPRQDLAIPGGVASVALVGPDKDLGVTFGADERSDLAAVRNDGTVLLFRGSAAGGVMSRRATVLTGASPSGGAGAHVVSGEFGGDVAQDVATVSADGRVVVTFGSVGGPRRAGRQYQTGPTAGAPAVGDFAGDDHQDLVFPATEPDQVRLLPMPGDEQISADATAGGLAAGFGRLLWWRRDGRGGMRLVERRSGTSRDLPVRVPSRPIRTIVGRNERDHPAVAYGRCARRCRAETLDLVTLRERPVALPLAKGCSAQSVAVWGHDVAYGSVVGRRCPASQRGMWLRRAGRTPRRLTSDRGLLGGLDSRHVAWVAYRDNAGRAFVDGPSGRHLVGLLQSPGVADFIDGSIRGPVFAGGRAWWAEWVSFISGDTGTFKRARADGRHCEVTARDVPTHDEELDAAVDRGSVYYANERGVFHALADSLNWRPEKCTSP
jgi:hypothetical protein